MPPKQPFEAPYSRRRTSEESQAVAGAANPDAGSHNAANEPTAPPVPERRRPLLTHLPSLQGRASETRPPDRGPSSAQETPRRHGGDFDVFEDDGQFAPVITPEQRAQHLGLTNFGRPYDIARRTSSIRGVLTGPADRHAGDMLSMPATGAHEREDESRRRAERRERVSREGLLPAPNHPHPPTPPPQAPRTPPAPEVPPSVPRQRYFTVNAHPDRASFSSIGPENTFQATSPSRAVGPGRTDTDDSDTFYQESDPPYWEQNQHADASGSNSGPQRAFASRFSRLQRRIAGIPARTRATVERFRGRVNSVKQELKQSVRLWLYKTFNSSPRSSQIESMDAGVGRRLGSEIGSRRESRQIHKDPILGRELFHHSDLSYLATNYNLSGASTSYWSTTSADVSGLPHSESVAREQPLREDALERMTQIRHQTEYRQLLGRSDGALNNLRPAPLRPGRNRSVQSDSELSSSKRR